MRHGSKAFKSGAAFAVFGMLLSSTAHAAPSALRSVDPLVSLSVFGTSSSRAAVCAAGTAAAAAAGATAAQPGPGAGCVLPVLGAAPAPPPPMVETVPVVPVATGGGIGFSSLLPLFAVFGLGALAIFLLENEDDDGGNPISPF